MLRPLLLLLLSAALSFAQSSPSAFTQGEGVQGEVNAIVVQPDGRVVIGGQFTSVNGVAVANLARLNADGSLDKGFSPSTEAGTNGPVYALALQADGKIVVGGEFTQAGSTNATNLARYNADGTRDATFGGESMQLGANAVVLAAGVRPDGQIVIGGSFSMVFGQPRRGIALLKPDGSLADSALPAVSGTVKAVGVLSGNKVVAGGMFSVQGQGARNVVLVSP